MGDHEIRKLGAALWKDLTKWLTGTDMERVLGLFRADTQTPKTFGWESKEPMVPRGLAPGTPQATWSFVPVSDLLLVIGEGLVGITSEGIFANNPVGHKRLKLQQCYKGINDKKSGNTKKPGRKDNDKDEEKDRDDDKAKASSQQQRTRSKWDVQAD